MKSAGTHRRELRVSHTGSVGLYISVSGKCGELFSGYFRNENDQRRRPFPVGRDAGRNDALQGECVAARQRLTLPELDQNYLRLPGWVLHGSADGPCNGTAIGDPVL